jgi:CMP-N,N'-diacetyllegionaminic acid synthase
MKKAEVLAIIPARGGSKSIPRKNLLSVAGQPLIAYSIAHARDCALITRTIVSTDDDEIADVARRFGAEVPFRRPAEAATDFATDLQVFRHALLFLQERGYSPDLVVHLRPTGPIRKPHLIEHAINLMLRHPEADSLRAIGLAEQTPYKMWRIVGAYLEQALELPGFPESHSMPRQKLPAIYHQNGYVDIVRPRTIIEMDSMVGQTVLPFVVEGKIHELDYPEQIPALTAAVLRFQRGEPEPDDEAHRHPA